MYVKLCFYIHYLLKFGCRLSVVVIMLALFNQLWIQLVLEWVTVVYGRLNHLGIWPAT